MNFEIEEKNPSAIKESLDRFDKIASYKSPAQSINEYTFVTSTQINEDDDEEESVKVSEVGDDSKNDTQEPIDNGVDKVVDDNDKTPSGGQETPNNASVGEDLGVPEFDEGDDVETTEMEGDDEVIDVDDLTQSQKVAEYKIDGVDDRLGQLVALTNVFIDKLKENEGNILKLKDEFEKRLPTQQEKLNIRSQASTPYCETPKEYLDTKLKTNGNYKVIYNNDVSPQDEEKEFKITKSDIEGINMSDIARSLEISPTLGDYLRF